MQTALVPDASVGTSWCMAESFLYLTTKGRKTALPRRIEIWFVEREGRHYIVSERRAESGWVKNLTQDPQVSFSVGPRHAPDSVVPELPARARTVDAAREPALIAAVSALMDQKYGWSEGLVVELEPAARAAAKS